MVAGTTGRCGGWRAGWRRELSQPCGVILLYALRCARIRIPNVAGHAFDVPPVHSGCVTVRRGVSPRGDQQSAASRSHKASPDEGEQGSDRRGRDSSDDTSKDRKKRKKKKRKTLELSDEGSTGPLTCIRSISDGYNREGNIQTSMAKCIQSCTLKCRRIGESYSSLSRVCSESWCTVCDCYPFSSWFGVLKRWPSTHPGNRRSSRNRHVQKNTPPELRRSLVSFFREFCKVRLLLRPIHRVRAAVSALAVH